MRTAGEELYERISLQLETELLQLRKESLYRLVQDLNPFTSGMPVHNLPIDLTSQLGAGCCIGSY